MYVLILIYSVIYYTPA